MANRTDPFSGYNFRVEIDGITRAGFKSCAGLDTSQPATDYREGTDAMSYIVDYLYGGRYTSWWIKRQ